MFVYVTLKDFRLNSKVFFYIHTTIYMYIILMLLLNNYNNVRVYHKERRSIYYGKKLNL
jgi:hypothetical protein